MSVGRGAPESAEPGWERSTRSYGSEGGEATWAGTERSSVVKRGRVAHTGDEEREQEEEQQRAETVDTEHPLPIAGHSWDSRTSDAPLRPSINQSKPVLFVSCRID